jgi:hypothetical protein
LNPRNGRGERSDARRLQSQMRRLFAASIRFKHTSSIASGEQRERTKTIPIIDESDLWWDPSHVRQGYLWDSWIELGESFYSTITATPVPLNLRALKTLKRSPLALDLYSWCCWRCWCVTRGGMPVHISWDSLHSQLGAEYTSIRDFKRKALAALRKIVEVEPALRMTGTATFLELRPSAPALPATFRKL